MTASKLCPHPGCTTKIERKAKSCKRHMTHNGTKPPVTSRDKSCALCDSPFQTTNPRQRYCIECRDATCVICGQTFQRNFRARKVVTTCSPSCTSKLASRDRTRQLLKCHCCGKDFSPANGHLEVKYCSLECKGIASRKPDTDKRRNSYKYRLWREAVYARDNYTCQHCGATGEIQAHHIKPWQHHKAMRYDVANGVTLCRTCHENIHGAHIPRVAKRFPTTCANCSCTTKGKSQYCRSCALKLSPKAKAAHALRSRNQNGQFLGSVEVSL